MTLHDYREILDRMASLNGGGATWQVTGYTLQVCCPGELLGS